jgi:tetratricopeptide (TPR) repeat protein
LGFSEGLSRRYPNDSRFKGGYAQDLFETGDHAGAVEAAREAIELDPKNPEPYATMSQAKFELGDYEGAAQDARRALDFNPKNLAYQSLLANSRSRAGAGASKGAAPQGGGLVGQSAAGEGGSGVSLQPQGEPGAMPEFRVPAGMVTVEDAERSKQAARAADQFLKERRFGEAVRLTDEALSYNAQNAAAIYTRALAHLLMKAYPLAQADIEAGLRLAPENARMLSLYSRVLSHQRMFDRALEAAERAIRSEPGFAEAYYHKAFALTGLGRRPEALAALGEAARLSPKYQAPYQRALQLPEDADLAFLFSGEALPAVIVQEGARPTGRSRDRNFLLIGIASLVGGFLIALGLLHTLTGEWMKRLKGRLTGSSKGPQSSPLGPVPAGDPSLIAGVYEVRGRLGIGGMGVVYEAFDRHLERKVAVKKMREEIRSDPRESARFLQEARMVAALHHPNIVEIYSIVEDGGDVYLVFQHVDGKTMHQLIDEQRRLPFAEALKLMEGCCAALDYAHRKNIIHRDLKPSNVMLDREGVVKVMDFGVARQAKDSLTRLSMTNTVVGTPPYMAPEQEQGGVCRESDVFALAVCLYEALTGELPYAGTGAAMLLGKMNKSYEPASRLAAGLPPGFDALLERVLEPDPAKRIRTAGEFYRELSSLVTNK